MIQVDGAFTFSVNEKEVKTYHCTQLKFPPCEGYLTVTNKRVVFHGFAPSLGQSKLSSMIDSLSSTKQTDSRIVNEVKIDSISGLSSFYGSKINYGRALLGIALAIVALVLFFTSRSTNWYTGRPQTSVFRIILGLACIGLAIWAFMRCFRRVFFLKILSSQATGAISIGEGAGGIIGGTAALSVVAMPTYETDLMIKELGAVIMDIQTLGDRGIEKWSSPSK